MIVGRDNLSVEDLFIRLAEHLSTFEHRPQQLELAHNIERAFRTKKTGIFEAGTGTGKSMAALIPAALSGKKVVVSTNTISLQEQYISKDIPLLKELLPFELNAVLLKGRGNYVGLRRWEEHLAERAVDERLIDWVNHTITGDISELDFMPPIETWLEINSDSDDCLRNKCPNFQECFYFDAKKRAEKADILVVNHALLLADAASYGSILPKYDLLIVDEAHHLPNVATDAFSASISNRGLRALCTRAVKRVGAPSGMVNDIDFEGHLFFERLAERCVKASTRLRDSVDGALQLTQSLSLLRGWLEEQEFEHLLDVNMARERAKLKAKALVTTINNYIRCLDLMHAPSADWVVWAERSDFNGLRMEVVAAPLNVSSFVRDLLIDKEGMEGSIWMSATLSTGGDDPFSFFKRSVGIEDHVIQERIPSPFDYAKQALLYLPKNLPEPNHGDFLFLATQEISRLISISEGRAFVLFTSRAAMNASFDLLQHRIQYPGKKQGEMPRKRLLEWFTETPNAVLFGTSSFWEGVSIDGDQLSCVIIDRIPFQVPDDPVHEARCDVLKNNPNSSWFNDLALPHATMRLKQGVGRLIRTHKDKGIVAILDSRLTGKYYGRRILECLPPMTIIRSLDGIMSLDARLGRVQESPRYSSADASDSLNDTSWRTRHSDMGQWSTR